MKCRGIEIEDGVYSGCDTQGGKLTDCPTCNGTGVETGRLVVELKKAASDCAMDRDYKLAELLDDAANVIGAFASRLNPTGQGRSDCGAYPGPGCSVSESKGNA